jgi:hypothetical protein
MDKNKKFKLNEIDAFLSQIEKRAEKGDYEKALLIKLKHNFMFKTEFDTNNAKDMILYKNIESTIQGLEALFNKEEEYFCLNCGDQI